MRNALTPVITLGALELGTLLSGAVLTEQIFTIPGFGKLIVDAVFNRDYAVVQGVVLVTATTYITLNLIADVLTCWSIRGCEAEMADATLIALVPRRADEPSRARRGGRCGGSAPQGRHGRPGRDRAVRRAGGVRAADLALRSGGAELDRGAQGALARRTGSAPTMSGATCSRA